MRNCKLINVSIVIPMLNEEKKLPLLYESLNRQVLSDGIKIKDVIAVDNGSVDNSLAISQQYCTAVYVRPDDTIARMRNFGAMNSSGDVLVFMDADCVLNDDVINEVVAILNDDMVTAVGPDGLIPIGKSTWVQKTWYLHTKILGSVDQCVDVENLSSGFFAVKAMAFSKVGGFNEALSIGEDTDLSRKLLYEGFRLIKCNRLRVYNSGHPATVLKFLKREYWHGDSFYHLLIHKKIELLTMYFILNAVSIVSSIVTIVLFNSLLFFFTYAFLSSLIPLYKAIKKTSNVSIDTIRLFIVYLLYVNVRTASLFKLK